MSSDRELAESVVMIHQFLRKQGYGSTARALKKDFKKHFQSDLPNGHSNGHDEDFSSSFGSRRPKRRARGLESSFRKKKRIDDSDDDDDIKGKQLPIKTKLFINNRWVESVSGRTFETVNPATEEVICDVDWAQKADVDAAVRAAHKAFPSWSQTNGSHRRDLILKLADLMEKHKERLAEVEALDNGKPYQVALHIDIALAIKCFRYYAGWADKMMGETMPIEGKYHCYTRREPVGVVGAITPWNFPILMGAWKLAPALAVGCCIIHKPSEKTPLTALMIAYLAKEAGFPPGVLNVVSGDGPTTGEAISRHPKIAKVAFTGSTPVGRRIMKCAAESNLKRVTLELGGKSPMIVCDDADIDQAVAAGQLGLFINSGQCCIASSRIFVQDGVYEEFIRKATKAAKSRCLVDPMEDGHKNILAIQGPQVDEVQYKKIMKYIEAGKREGARLCCGGSRGGTQGYYIEPTVFADVEDDMKIAREEIFGPVMVIMRFSTLEEAIKRGNNTDFGLGAGIFTKDAAKALATAHRLHAGTVYVNCYNVFDTSAPFGGFKQSGHGRELGPYGLDNYSEIKTVIVDLNTAKFD
mmetsp:Transcript_12726/g.23094  ORF Transcript_12726/g.23094 Transcript_12726/m.23094 type:complete len:582 (+) Transcript_12726:107-1852(+)|eukprot:CAMPEP_0197515216 /NCGR_PEP_ID=MMETSP1318-20131121/412_1 /TAXON_ID=552666 /ORGANISM="Partenskyella glossopodia, Strain RCC365" /LENGTH=581 /DNA_ID=CAMNT_0043063525 /DNA_START=81 /DNA_END=1826 /DNA_ORIENTATION=+